MTITTPESEFSAVAPVTRIVRWREHGDTTPAGMQDKRALMARRIAFTATGQLVSAGFDGSVCWWWLEVEPLRQAVEQLDVGGLTEAERDRVAHMMGD